MLKSISILILFFIVSMGSHANISFKLKSSPPTFDSLSVIIALKNEAKSDYSTVKTAINNMSNIKYIAFCDNHSIYMFYIDKNTYENANFFFKQLITINPSITSLIYLKKGNINELLNSCSFIDPSDASNIKH